MQTLNEWLDKQKKPIRYLYDYDHYDHDEVLELQEGTLEIALKIIRELYLQSLNAPLGPSRIATISEKIINETKTTGQPGRSGD